MYGISSYYFSGGQKIVCKTDAMASWPAVTNP